jgi:hypothetical protein
MKLYELSGFNHGPIEVQSHYAFEGLGPDVEDIAPYAFGDGEAWCDWSENVPEYEVTSFRAALFLYLAPSLITDLRTRVSRLEQTLGGDGA